MSNIENLTQEEIERKIKYLNASVARCLIQSGPVYCVNREERIKTLQLYKGVGNGKNN